MSESARGEGGRVWVPEDQRRQARSGRAFPNPSAGTSWKSGIRSTATWCRVTSPPAPSTKWCTSTISASMASRWSIWTSRTSIARRSNRKLEGILEIYEKFVGDDPRDVPMKIFPGMHYTMGGLWVDSTRPPTSKAFTQPANANISYHGANRLGANSLVSCILRRLYCRARKQCSTPGTAPSRPTA